MGGLAELGVKRLVLQPTSGWPSLRRTLILGGWTITDEVINSEAGWLYITHVAELAEESEALTDDQVLTRTLLGPGALMQGAQGSQAEAELLRFWIQRQLEHYQTRRAGILKGLASRAAGALVGSLGAGQGEEAGGARSTVTVSGDSDEETVHGNPGNLGPQKLTEVDSRIQILSQALSTLGRGGSSGGGGA
jgi:hypothetical protein